MQELLYQKQSPVSPVKVTPIAHLYEIYFNDDIGYPVDHMEEVQAIRSAGPGDVVHITVNTCGGVSSTMNEILSAIKQCPAHIVTEAVGDCHSAGTFLLLK